MDKAKGFGTDIRSTMESYRRKAKHEVYKMTEQEAKKRESINFEELFKKHALAICPSYRKNIIIQNLLEYFIWLTKHPETTKGLFVYGSLGVGKSMFFEIIRSIAYELVRDHAYNGLWFSECTAPWMVSERMASTKDGYTGSFDISSYHKGRLYIDDLGAENLCFNKYELLEEVLFQRHRNKALTFVTTNLTPEEISKKYGARVFDRLGEMFHIVKWTGKSLR